jgi:excisionase family DNA binding protein
MTQPPRLLTASEVVERLAAKGVPVHIETVRNWARQRKVRHVRLPGGDLRFDAADVDALVVPIPAKDVSVA